MKKYIMATALALVLSAAVFVDAQARAICPTGQVWVNIKCEPREWRDQMKDSGTSPSSLAPTINAPAGLNSTPPMAGRVVKPGSKPVPGGTDTSNNPPASTGTSPSGGGAGEDPGIVIKGTGQDLRNTDQPGINNRMIPQRLPLVAPPTGPGSTEISIRRWCKDNYPDQVSQCIADMNRIRDESQ